MKCKCGYEPLIYWRRDDDFFYWLCKKCPKVTKEKRIKTPIFFTTEEEYEL